LHSKIDRYALVCEKALGINNPNSLACFARSS
jgi:hypothetical protein